MGNLESKIAEGEGKHTPAANSSKEINEIKLDTSNSTRRRDSVTTISSFVLATISTVGGVSLIGSSFINTGQNTSDLGNITSTISIENIFSNSAIISVEITNLDDNKGELHIDNRFFSKTYTLQEGMNEINCIGLSDRTTYNVEVIVNDTIISKTNFKTTIDKETTLNRWEYEN